MYILWNIYSNKQHSLYMKIQMHQTQVTQLYFIKSKCSLCNPTLTVLTIIPCIG